jgi:hypothetical protein
MHSITSKFYNISYFFKDEEGVITGLKATYNL